MDKNKKILKLVLIFFALIAVSRNINIVKFDYIARLYIGFSLILLYKFKNKIWSLIAGIYIINFSLLDLFVKNISLKNNILIINNLFLIPGIVFIYFYIFKNKQKLLVPGSIMLWSGIYLLSTKFIPYHIQSIQVSKSNIFFICFASTFFLIYVINKKNTNKNLLYISLAMYTKVAYNLVIKQYHNFLTYAILFSLIIFIMFKNKKI